MRIYGVNLLAYIEGDPLTCYRRHISRFAIFSYLSGEVRNLIQPYLCSEKQSLIHKINYVTKVENRRITGDSVLKNTDLPIA